MENGHRVWKKYDTLYVDGEDFEEIGKAFEKVHTLGKGLISEACVRLMRQRELVDFAVKWMEQNR